MWTQIGGFYDYNLYDDCIYEDGLRRLKVRCPATVWTRTNNHAAVARSRSVHRSGAD
jgi:hypothetical protein